MTLRDRELQSMADHASRTVHTILVKAAARHPQYSFVGIFESSGLGSTRSCHYRASGSAQLLLDVGKHSEIMAAVMLQEATTEERSNILTKRTSLYIYVGARS